MDKNEVKNALNVVADLWCEIDIPFAKENLQKFIYILQQRNEKEETYGFFKTLNEARENIKDFDKRIENIIFKFDGGVTRKKCKILHMEGNNIFIKSSSHRYFKIKILKNKKGAFHFKMIQRSFDLNFLKNKKGFTIYGP